MPPDSLRAPAPSLHDADDEPSGAFRVGRAKQVARPKAPNLFDRACSASSMSNRQIATLLGVNESSVRKMRDGRLAPRPDYYGRLPKESRAYLCGVLSPDDDPMLGKVVSLLDAATEMLKARRGGT